MLACLHKTVKKNCKTSACLVDVWALLSTVLFVIFSYRKHKVRKSDRSPFWICKFLILKSGGRQPFECSEFAIVYLELKLQLEYVYV